MADISGKTEQIKILVDRGDYFTINRARQFGKTTMLYALRKRLANEYLAIKISFEGIGGTPFESDENFCINFMELVRDATELIDGEEEYAEKWFNCDANTFKLLSRHITKMCRNKKIVLMIDEVDKTSNNQVFLHFISTLRDKYLAAKNGDDFTFHSVILAGVYDIKNIKLKMISEGLYTPTLTEEKTYNSPWNIAVKFDIDMSFSPPEIASMLKEYEADHDTGMNIAEISQEIYNYTSGYPFLVSRICQCIDEELDKNWTVDGIQKAVKITLEEANTLFDDMFKNIRNNEKLRDFLYELLFVGREMPFNIDNEIVSLGTMFGFFKNVNGQTKISNKIFELRIYNYFIVDEITKSNIIFGSAKEKILRGGRFNMEECLRRFADHYNELISNRDMEFLERHGRLLFLSYLKPLINGEGFYHIEPEISDFRMDIVVDYGREQFIVELKIWRGEKYEEKAYEQLAGYMETKKADKGYLLIFDFREEANKERKTEWIDAEGKQIFEVIV
jgi:hypothetical protein